jgi:peptidyl-tRNA hydrolase, PTH1 family
MGQPFRLVVGLGNPGREHRHTRHNAGFWFVERLAATSGVSFRDESKFNGQVAKLVTASGDIRLLMPQTFMNRSGSAVAAIARFFRIAPGEILVVHDELDLKPGVVKLKQGGGTAGHNGLKDIAAQLATKDFWRLRIGIGHPRDTAHSESEVVDYVLHAPSASDEAAIKDAMDRALATWPRLAAGETERAMHELHTSAASPDAAEIPVADGGRATLAPPPAKRMPK